MSLSRHAVLPQLLKFLVHKCKRYFQFFSLHVKVVMVVVVVIELWQKVVLGYQSMYVTST